MPLIQPASVLLSDQAGISVGRSAATPNAPICAQAWATHITTTARFTRETAGIRQRRRQGSASRGHYPANRKARPPCYPIARSILLRGGRVPTAKDLAWSVTLRLSAEKRSTKALAVPSRAAAEDDWNVLSMASRSYPDENVAGGL